MLEFIKSILFGKTETPKEKQEKEKSRKFDILKYDGIRAIRSGKNDYGERCLIEALKIYKDPETLRELAFLYKRTGRWEEALMANKELIDIDPQNVNYLFETIDIYRLKKEYDNAIDTVNKIISMAPENFIAYYMKACIQREKNDNIMALATITQALTINEYHPEGHLLRAEILLAMNQFEQAEKDIITICNTDDSDYREETYLLKARIALAIGKGEEAITTCNEVLTENAFCQEAYLICCETLLKEKNIEQAIDILNTAIELMPNFAEAYYKRGKAKHIKADAQGAIDDLKKALELNPELEKEISGEFHNRK